MRLFLSLSFSFALLITISFSVKAGLSEHPFAPLSEQELKKAVSVLKKAELLGNGWYLQLLRLVEPPKELVLGGMGRDIKRNAFAIVIHIDKNENYEVVIDLKENKISKKTKITRGQPALLMTEYDKINETIHGDEGIKKALKRRGIEDINKVYIDAWGVGEIGKPDAAIEYKINKKHRLARATFDYKGDAINPYGRPVPGLSIIYDLTENRIIDMIDYEEIVKMPSNADDFFNPAWISEVSDGVVRMGADAESSVKERNFFVNGNEITWQGFRFVAFLHPREGLVIGQVGFQDQKGARSILYRGSLSEMVVPYGDPDREWYWRCAFDEGDYGLSDFTNSLELGSQVPVDAYTMDATFADNDGKLKKFPRVIAIFEREAGLLWSHYDEDTKKIAAQRGRELVVMSIFTISNYDYVIQWVFKQDATIEVNAFLTGVIAGKAVGMEKCGKCEVIAKGGQLSAGDRYGAIVAPKLIGVIHQHFFNFRLDFAIEGINNTVAEVRYMPIDNEKENPSGNAFTYEEEILPTELKAARTLNANEGRHWWVFNRNKTNSLGHFPGFTLDPIENAVVYGRPSSQALTRAPFLKNSLWVTKFNDGEMHAAGDYPNQNSGDGLTEWTKRDAPIDNQDIVVWYTFGVNHLPRAEEWPVMPVSKAGFLLKPKGFFERSPALNVVTASQKISSTKKPSEPGNKIVAK